jgi:isoquinoline 1-oxidoreductase/isoquinoline 1-oxidoreductase beta subunit
VWAPTQAPGAARVRVAEVLGLEPRDVTVHTTLLGGGFGRRINQDFAEEAAVIAARTGRPVKVIWSREEDLANDFYRPMSVARMRGAVDESGRIVAWHHRLVAQSVVSHSGPDFVGALVPTGTPRPLRRLLGGASGRTLVRGPLHDFTSYEGAADLPYAIPNLAVEFTVVEPGVPNGWWRSVGHSHNGFTTEAFLDELGHLARRDPFELRRALLAGSPRHRRVLELAAEKAGWGRPLARGVGRGIAVHASFGSWCAHVIEASVEGAEVRVRRVVSAIDCGRAINPAIVRSQIEGGVVFGLSAALGQAITFARGRVQETNFDGYPLLRMHECPAIEVHIAGSSEEPSGVGEPGVPPVAPALCGAIFAASGRRVRRLPIAAALAEDAP